MSNTTTPQPVWYSGEAPAPSNQSNNLKWNPLALAAFAAAALLCLVGFVMVISPQDSSVKLLTAPLTAARPAFVNTMQPQAPRSSVIAHGIFSRFRSGGNAVDHAIDNAIDGAIDGTQAMKHVRPPVGQEATMAVDGGSVASNSVNWATYREPFPWSDSMNYAFRQTGENIRNAWASLVAAATPINCIYLAAALAVMGFVSAMLAKEREQILGLFLAAEAAAVYAVAQSMAASAAVTAHPWYEGIKIASWCLSVFLVIPIVKFWNARQAGEGVIQDQIASFYDDTSKLWEDVWGEHMHHGYYTKPVKSHKDNIDAQEEMVEQVLMNAGVHKWEGPMNILDAGCGIGGSARHMARKYPEAKVAGITLSPFQCARANDITQKAGLDERVKFTVADAMKTPFPDNSFDIVYSMESGEHMPDKQKFIEECNRVLRPGGVLVMAVWCHRECPPSLTDKEEQLLQKIYKTYALPYVCELSYFAKAAEDLGMARVSYADWTHHILPFWGEVIKKCFSFAGFVGLLRSGITAIQGAYASWWMQKAVSQKLFVFGFFTATKTDGKIHQF